MYETKISASDHIPCTDSLVSELLWVPTLLKDENLAEVIETSTMATQQRR